VKVSRGRRAEHREARVRALSTNLLPLRAPDPRRLVQQPDLNVGLARLLSGSPARCGRVLRSSHVGYVEELLAVIDALNRHGVEYVLIGGGALNVHGLVRATEDLDLVIAPTANNVESLKSALRSIWSDPEIDRLTAEDLLGDYPAVRYGPPQGDLYLDILTRLGELADYESIEAEVVDVGGIEIRVATPQSLFRLKRNTVRPIDRADAEALREALELGDDDAD
jgi:hypothetical protein